MDPTTEEIETNIREKREDLRSNIEELGDKVKTATDWRHYYREHTGPILAVAFGLGALVAMSRSGRSSQGSRMNSSSMTDRARQTANQPMNKVNGGMASMSDAGSKMKRQRTELTDRWDTIKRALVGAATAQLTGVLGRAIPGFHDHLQDSERGANRFVSNVRDAPPL